MSTTEAAAAEFEVAFLEGIARHLAAPDGIAEDGIGTWRANGAYAAGETALVVGGIPQTPDRLIALMGYGVDDDPTLSDSVQGLQVTTRWGGQDPRDVGRLTSKVFDQLHGLYGVILPTGVHVAQIVRTSHTSIGQDANNRWRTVQNFYCTVHRPSAHRF